LENRTVADVTGKVMGEAGPLMAGVPGASVILMKDGTQVKETTTDSQGSYKFSNILHGANYSISAEPSMEHRPVVDLRSGYLMNTTFDLTVSGAQISVDIMLPFEEHQPPDWLEIEEYFPMGDNVSLDQEIIVGFTHPVNISTFIEAFTIEPYLMVNFTLNDEKDKVIMSHELFVPNTTYTVTINGTVLSEDGWPLLDYLGASWNFTTSDSVATWKVSSAHVDVLSDMTVEIEVTGISNMTLYVVIDGVGSFQMVEDLPANYKISISPESFEWETTYSYHFSDTEDGEDMAPGFAGTFTTPEAPGEEWTITSATVEPQDDGGVDVEAMGPSGQTVWINVVGVGWYELTEEEDGIYRITIPAGDLEMDTEYDYFFSDEEGGEDLVPTLGGSFTTVQEPVVDDDDDDDDDSSLFGNTFLTILACCGILFLFIIVILVIVVVIKKRGKEEKWGEE
jgi:hypothetical protein